MALAEQLGLDEARVRRRIGFLEDRVSAHLSADGPFDPMRVACAGGLLRDAAASAMLLQEYDRARELLAYAGEAWTRLGLFSGYALLAMSTPQPWWTTRGATLDEVREELTEATRKGGESSRRTHRSEAPMMASSTGSTRQLLHLYQSLRPHAKEDDAAAIVAEVARERLGESSTAQVGATEAPLHAYVHLLDATVNGDMDRRANDTLSGLVLRRAEQLEAARADKHHWRMGLAPAALVDFDLLALATASMDAQGSVEPVDRHFRERDLAVRIPLIVARGMRPG